MTTPAAPAPGAVEMLAHLVSLGFKPERLDELHDYMRLLGVVLGQMTLLTIATSSHAKDEARVSAAKALMQLKETPEALAERLKRSPFADLTVAQLEAIVSQLKTGNTDIPAIITSVKKEG